jgi:GTP-binding protein EngB required for normal cell division
MSTNFSIDGPKPILKAEKSPILCESNSLTHSLTHVVHFTNSFILQGGMTTQIPPVHQKAQVGSTTQNDSSLEHLTMDMKDLIKKIQDLSHLGIENRQIALPKICVVGDQSTGKSSLIEGISEIQVPRSEGTCTRCPLEINLSQSEEPWKCVIHLSRQYWFDNDKRKDKVLKKTPLGPWVPIGGHDDELFTTLTDRNAVQNAIRCAQLAILNPHVNPKDFLPELNDIPQTFFVQFSPNAVRLDISGPGFPNLSFYDLPGVISQTEQDDEGYLVNLVENLVKDYVSQKNCIVLLTLPMTDDATNSSAARLVRAINGAKERTLGVLTKPDRRPSGESFEQWQQILQGKKFKLGHGYYVIRNNPDPAVSHEQAREEEDLFFSQTLWKDELAILQDRFGIKNLQTALSELLKDQILGSLPSIVEEIDKRAKEIEDELQRLPNPPTEDVQRILWAKTSALERKFDEIIDGTWCPAQTSAHKKPLHEQWNMIVLDFQTALSKTRPVLNYNAQKDKEDLGEGVDSDCDMQIIDVKASPSKRRKLPVDTPIESPPAPEAPKIIPSAYATKYFEGLKRSRFSLQLLSELKIRSNTVGVPNQLDPRAIENLNKRIVQHWDTLSEIFIKATHSLVHGMLLEALEEEFVQYHQTGLYQELRKILKDYLTQVHTNHREIAKEYYQAEREVPFTMAQGMHQRLMVQVLEELKEGRFKARATCYLTLRGQEMNDFKIADKIQKTKDKLGPDRYSQEIDMMAVSVLSDMTSHPLIVVL